LHVPIITLVVEIVAGRPVIVAQMASHGPVRLYQREIQRKR